MGFNLSIYGVGYLNEKLCSCFVLSEVLTVRSSMLIFLPYSALASNSLSDMPRNSQFHSRFPSVRRFMSYNLAALLNAGILLLIDFISASVITVLGGTCIGLPSSSNESCP